MDVLDCVRSIIDMEKMGNRHQDIENRSMEIIQYLNENDLAKNVNNIIYHFLEDFDVRRKDSDYCERQIEQTEREMLRITDENLYQPIL